MITRANGELSIFPAQKENHRILRTDRHQQCGETLIGEIKLLTPGNMRQGSRLLKRGLSTVVRRQ
jgi:hypothetical protein